VSGSVRGISLWDTCIRNLADEWFYDNPKIADGRIVRLAQHQVAQKKLLWQGRYRLDAGAQTYGPNITVVPGIWEAMLHLTTWDTLLLPDIILMDVLTLGMQHKGQDVDPIQACPRPIITKDEDEDEGACGHNQTHHNE
jgi:hypothetical protein